MTVGPPKWNHHRKITVRGGPWHLRAACRDTDPALFFPEGYAGIEAEKIEDAKQVCAGCPVWEFCLEEALRNGDYGIWGGTTEDERRVIKRGRVLERREREAIGST